jgi:biopolymer transport protein ExbD
MRLHPKSEKDVNANTVPLIDVIFPLLAFLVISILFLTRSQGLPLTLPIAPTTKIERSAQVTITINSKGDIFFNKQPVQIKTLDTIIKAKMAPNQEILVVLNADGNLKYKEVLAVISQIRKVSGAKFAIATVKL